MSPEELYGTSLTLLIDLYELTMAAGYFKAGIAERQAAFQLFFRKQPFKGGFAISAGLELAMGLIDRFRFDESDLEYLQSLKGSRGVPLFEQAFLDYLSTFEFSCDIDAMPEGTVVFPKEPLMVVTGPIIQAQLLESMILNVINFQSLIATKASRICAAAAPDEVVEFGVRRAQGIDGALSASRASFIGGCLSTSHVLAGKFFGIPVKGTHAHSWIMAFDDEEEAFRTYAQAMPQNCIFLVDTYNTVRGVKRSIKVAKELEKEDIRLLGVRLDSGDISALSIEIRKLLDDAGLRDTIIMASNELDEYLIRDVKEQGAMVTLWGVGTNLVTGKDQPALDGVYKLTAIKNVEGKWEYKLKISDQIAKVTSPGITQVRRFKDSSGNIADMLYDVHMGISQKPEMINLHDNVKVKTMDPSLAYEDLLIPIYRKGKRVYQSPSIFEIQKKTLSELSRFPPSMKRFINPAPYFVGMEKSLHELKIELIKKLQEE